MLETVALKVNTRNRLVNTFGHRKNGSKTDVKSYSPRRVRLLVGVIFSDFCATSVS